MFTVDLCVLNKLLSAVWLFHSNALREVPRLVNIGALDDRYVIGEELKGNGEHQRGVDAVDLRHLDDVAGRGACYGALVVSEDIELAAPCPHGLYVGLELLEELVRGGDNDNRHVGVNERDGPVLELSGGIALSVDVADFLELQRTLERDGEMHSPPEEEAARLLQEPCGHRLGGAIEAEGLLYVGGKGLQRLNELLLCFRVEVAVCGSQCACQHHERRELREEGLSGGDADLYSCPREEAEIRLAHQG